MEVLISACRPASPPIAAPLPPPRPPRNRSSRTTPRLHANIDRTLATLERLGVTRVKVAVRLEASIAPATRHSFHEPKASTRATPRHIRPPTGPSTTTSSSRRRLDGIKVGFMLTGPAPLWATGPGMPKQRSNCPCGQWKPSAAPSRHSRRRSASATAAVHAHAARAPPLPRVSWWSIWNEPNYGPTWRRRRPTTTRSRPARSSIAGCSTPPGRALAATGHTHRNRHDPDRRDRPARPRPPVGNFSGVKPLRFLRALYCVNACYQPLRGAAAARAAARRPPPARARSAPRTRRCSRPAATPSTRTSRACRPTDRPTPCDGIICSHPYTVSERP